MRRRAVTSSTQPSELGPEPSDHLGRVEHWCEVVIWLTQQHQQDYLDGELRSCLAIYHAIGLIADAARGLRPEVLQDVPSVNWVGLFGMRTILVHRPWLVASDNVWSAATREVPSLLAEVRRYIAQREM